MIKTNFEIGDEVYFLNEFQNMNKEIFYNIVKTKIDGYCVDKKGISYSVESDTTYRDENLLSKDMNKIIEKMLLKVTDKL